MCVMIIISVTWYHHYLDELKITETPNIIKILTTNNLASLKDSRPYMYARFCAP